MSYGIRRSHTSLFQLFVAFIIVEIGSNANVPLLHRSGAIAASVSAGDESVLTMPGQVHWTCGAPTGIVSFNGGLYAAVGSRVVQISRDVEGRLTADQDPVTTSASLIGSISTDEAHMFLGMQDGSVSALAPVPGSDRLNLVSSITMTSAIRSLTPVNSRLIVGTVNGITVLSKSSSTGQLSEVSSSRLQDVLVDVWNTDGWIVAGGETDLGGSVEFMAVDGTGGIVPFGRLTVPAVPVLVSGFDGGIIVIDRAGFITVIDPTGPTLVGSHQAGQEVLAAFPAGRQLVIVGRSNVISWNIDSESTEFSLPLAWANERTFLASTDSGIAMISEGGHLAHLGTNGQPRLTQGSSICGRTDIVVSARGASLAGNKDSLWILGELGADTLSSAPEGSIGGCYDAVIADNKVYCASGGSGLRIGHVDESRRIVWDNRVPLAGISWGVTVDKGHAYVAAGMRGLHVVDVSAPDNPIAVSEVSIPGYAQDVAIVNDLAFIATRFEGLQEVEVKAGLKPRVTGAHAVEKTVVRLDRTLDGLALALWHNGVGQFSNGVITQIDEPSVSQTLTLDVAWESEGLLWTGRHDGSATLARVIDGTEVNRIHAPAAVMRISAEPSRAMFATGAGGVGILHELDPERLFIPLTLAMSATNTHSFQVDIGMEAKNIICTASMTSMIQHGPGLSTVAIPPTYETPH